MGAKSSRHFAATLPRWPSGPETRRLSTNKIYCRASILIADEDVDCAALTNAPVLPSSNPLASSKAAVYLARTSWTLRLSLLAEESHSSSTSTAATTTTSGTTRCTSRRGCRVLRFLRQRRGGEPPRRYIAEFSRMSASSCHGQKPPIESEAQLIDEEVGECAYFE